jgi:hypothetical protein
MVPLHHFPERTIEPGTELTASMSGFYLPLIGTMLAMVGLLLVIAGLMEMPAPVTPARRGWIQTQVVGDMATMASKSMPLGRAWAYPSVMPWSSPESIRVGDRWRSRRFSSITSASTKTPMPDVRRPASSTSRPLRHDSDDQIAKDLFPDGIEPSVPGIVRSELQHKVADPRNCIGTGANAHEADPPLCQDPRAALAMMAAAQHRATGMHWDGTGAAVATRATDEDRIASALFAPVSVVHVR